MPRHKPNKKSPLDTPFMKATTYIPRNMYADLQDLSVEKRLPVSRLIAEAISSEFDRPKEERFDCECILPNDEYQEYKYAGEAGRIATFLEVFNNGLRVDLLLLCRHMMNINDKKTFLYALRELYKKNMVEFIRDTKHIGTWRAILVDERLNDKRRKYQPIETESYVIKGEIDNDDV